MNKLDWLIRKPRENAAFRKDYEHTERAGTLWCGAIQRWRQENKLPPCDSWAPYSPDRWRAGLKTSVSEISQHVGLSRRPKPFLTAAGLVMLREMKVGL